MKSSKLFNEMNGTADLLGSCKREYVCCSILTLNCLYTSSLTCVLLNFSNFLRIPIALSTLPWETSHLKFFKYKKKQLY